MYNSVSTQQVLGKAATMKTMPGSPVRQAKAVREAYPDSLPCRLSCWAGRKAMSSTRKEAGSESW